MSGFDEQRLFYTDQQLARASDSSNRSDANLNNNSAVDKFRLFLRDWTIDQINVYREQIRANVSQNHRAVVVDMRDLFQFDAQIALALCTDPARFLPLFEQAAINLIDSLLPAKASRDSRGIQVQLIHLQRKTSMRDVDSSCVSKLVSIPGIVIGASNIRPKAKKLIIQCRGCQWVRSIDVSSGFGGAQLPRSCDNTRRGPDDPKCPMDPFSILADQSQFEDYQSLKLQERPEHVPNGDMPRHLALSCDRHLVGKVKPGSRVEIVGIFSTFQSKKAGEGGKSSGLRQPYIQVVGIEHQSEEAVNLTPEDEEMMRDLARSRSADGQMGIYEFISRSIAPAIYGHDDIKKAIACQLVGGSRKHLPDGLKLRGDINVLLLGDPSVAKSQFLKFANQVAPISVYTSGKGSSAAGLTASVIKDPASGEFHLEGGALVLGDGGIVCIDEFDKMREQDRVAIHEAMEQQTISIAKAGITTILNARASILAAANPVHGRYDVLLSAGENITLQTTILSRFDMIFILLDKADKERDRLLSEHVLGIHQKMNDDSTLVSDNRIAPELLRKYISFCRQSCRPRLSEEGSELLRNHYVSIRSKVKGERGDSPIPITVRQLEAIVRISEALARLELSESATAKHVNEAIRLFKSSTLNAAESGVMIEGMGSSEQRESVQKAEDFIKSRIGIGTRVSREGLKRQYLVLLQTGPSRQSVVDLKPFELALHAMQSRNEVQFINQGKILHRTR